MIDITAIRDRLSRVVRDGNGNARVFSGKIVDDAAELLDEVTRLRAELEAAKRDLAKAKPCDCCVHQYSGDCILEESFDPCSSYIEGGRWEWRGVTENGGANETD